MEFEGYNDIFLCVRPDVFEQITAEKRHSGVKYGIVITEQEDLEALRRITPGLFDQRGLQFCLFFREAMEPATATDIQAILLLFYSTHYFFRHGRPQVYFIQKEGERQHEKARLKINDAVSGLNFEPDILTCLLPQTAHRENPEYLVIDNSSSQTGISEIQAEYLELLRSSFFVNKAIYLFFDSLQTAEAALYSLANAEKSIAGSHPELHDLYKQHILLTAQLEKMFLQNKRLKMLLANNEKYLFVLRKDKEMERVIEFYHREYEALPGWYKKMGHILKVLTGKRTFKSLFD